MQDTKGKLKEVMAKYVVALSNDLDHYGIAPDHISITATASGVTYSVTFNDAKCGGNCEVCEFGEECEVQYD